MNRGPKARKINHDLLENIGYYATRGLSLKQICLSLGFSETWCNANKAENSELGKAYIKGSASGLADVTIALYGITMNGNPVS